MKNFFLLFFAIPSLLSAQQWIRTNLLGYTPDALKIAVCVSKDTSLKVVSFVLHEALTDEIIYTSDIVTSFGAYGPFPSAYRLDFSQFRIPGAYYISIGETQSSVFRIAYDLYNGSSDVLLKYMRQQRSGYNPFLNDSCHTHDGFIIYHPSLDSTHIDVSGGWHDASDYLQYVTTSATAVYQMLFAYQQHPSVFGDLFTANGSQGKNGIPDILDEAKWGLDWLVKMNPHNEMYFNQIADDRDHRGFRLPTEDTVNYGRGKERPVYFINGQPQGIYQYKNRTTGVASTVAKFSSSFALGANVLQKYYPVFAADLSMRAAVAYEFAKKYPGVSQTAPCRAPYFYEEDNWVDDMELAAAQLAMNSGETKYLNDAIRYGNLEPMTPWLGADTARHYQWYPFTNIGHALVAKNSNEKDQFISYLRRGIDTVFQKGKTNAFIFGIPFIWCSNNLVSSFLTQMYLYRSLSNDHTYDAMEASLRDWLFGCNPWGTSMVVGFPPNSDSPTDPHSAFTHVYHYPITGGLVDGPVRATIFEQHKRYIHLTKADPYAEFQSSLAVYHDDWGDYTNNEPTMDGTAGLTMVLSTLENNPQNNVQHVIVDQGGIIRMDTTKKDVFLVFTGHEFADGGLTLLKTLRKHSVKASFFFTGDFYRTKEFSSIITQLKKDGHYLGAHSDRHLLYAPWEKRDSLLIDQKIFIDDLKNNYKEMKRFGITPTDAPYFLPPYEWYNHSIADWAKGLGLALINFTPGTSSNADYTTPDMANYVPSDTIYDRILRYEGRSETGLNGFVLLSHIGTSSGRTDKFYAKLDGLILELKKRGYNFKRL